MQGSRIAVDDNPRDLKIVAILFIIEGLFGAFDTTLTMNRDIEAGVFPMHINLMLIGFPVSVGLLRNRKAWRITGVAISWIQMAIMSIIMALYAVKIAGIGEKLPENMQIQLEIWLVPGPFGAVLLALFGLIVAIWKYRILRKTEIRELFK